MYNGKIIVLVFFVFLAVNEINGQVAKDCLTMCKDYAAEGGETTEGFPESTSLVHCFVKYCAPKRCLNVCKAEFFPSEEGLLECLIECAKENNVRQNESLPPM